MLITPDDVTSFVYETGRVPNGIYNDRLAHIRVLDNTLDDTRKYAVTIFHNPWIEFLSGEEKKYFRKFTEEEIDKLNHLRCLKIEDSTEEE